MNYTQEQIDALIGNACAPLRAELDKRHDWYDRGLQIRVLELQNQELQKEIERLNKLKDVYSAASFELQAKERETNRLVDELQNKLGSLQQAVCKECKGGGEIGLSDGEVPCPTCGGSGDPLHPGSFTIKREGGSPKPYAGYKDERVDLT